MDAWRRTILLIVELALAASLAGCVERFEVIVQNSMATPATIRIAQFHSEGFNGEPPKNFTPNLLIQQQTYIIGPGESKTLSFSSASGGFWLQWQQLDPAGPASQPSTLRLLENEREIVLR